MADSPLSLMQEVKNIEKIKEKRAVKKGLKEKAKSAPKELVRHGLGDGTERLRGQLRDTAQRGQADDYGGDRIEDTAVGGARWMERGAERGVESLLKKRKERRGQTQEAESPTAPDPSTPQEPPAEHPSPHEPPPREQPKIKTREAVTAREGGAPPSRGGRTEPASAAGPDRLKIKMRKSAVRNVREVSDGTEPAAPNEPERPKIRTRETAVHDVCADAPSEPQGRPELPQIKTRETVTDAASGHTPSTAPSSREKPSERMSIKTKDTYIRRQPAPQPEQPSPQAFTQGQRGFVQQRGRAAAMKRAEGRRTGNGAVPQPKGSEKTSPPAPARRGYTSAHPVHKPVRPGNPDTQPVRDGGKAIVKTGRSVRKASERTARHAIKTADHSARKTIKNTQRTAKTAARTTKTAAQTAKTAQRTAQATIKATQRAVQAARATAKSAATTAKATAKATVAAVKAAIAAVQALAAAIAAGGWVAIVIVLVICMVGMLIASPFGIFFSGGDSPDAVSPSAAVAQINREYADTLSGLQAGGSYDSVEIVGRPPSWMDVFAVFSVKTVSGDGMNVVVLDADRVERLRTVFWDMTKITTATRTVDHPATEDEEAWTETVLTITVTPRTVDDMRVFYQFTEEQNAELDSLLTPESRDLWNQLLYGNSGEIVAVALSQVGNVGGQPYWSWYGFNSRVEWCACFVSWCANECGYIDAGVIPKFAGCTGGSNWFKARGQWQEGSYEPRPGDLVFFDWDNKGSSGPQDDVPDHVGIVERVENGVVYTVEGNSGDSCRQNSYSVGHYEVWGYATPIY